VQRGAGVPEQNGEHQCDQAADEQAPLDEVDARQLLGEGTDQEKDDRPAVCPERDRDLGEPGVRARDDAALRTRRDCRPLGQGVVLHVDGTAGAGVGDHGERGRIGPEDVVDDDTHVEHRDAGIRAVLPLREVESLDASADRHSVALQLVELRVDEAALERRHDDQVGHRERSCDHAEQRERQAEADAADHRSRKRYPTPRTVRINSGSRGSRSIFSRR
jgi:hypothetical protein